MSYLLLFVLFNGCKISQKSCAGAEKSAEQKNLEVQASLLSRPKIATKISNFLGFFLHTDKSTIKYSPLSAILNFLPALLSVTVSTDLGRQDYLTGKHISPN